MTTVQRYTVSGMSCGHCENAIRDELAELIGISHVEVSAAEGSLAVTLSDGATVTSAAIIDAVEEAGYEATHV